jgi:glycosyltransferase involved in cell wall biosynthesis
MDHLPKSILFVAQHRLNRSPSQRYRFEQYLKHFEANGIKCDLAFLLNEDDDSAFYAHGKWGRKAIIVIKSFLKRLHDISRAAQYDLVFIQREAFMTGTVFFESAFAKLNAKVVFDFDDSIWLSNVSDANRQFNFLKNPQKTARLVAMSDHVIAGNTYLADYALKHNKEVTVIPTTIDTDEYQPISFGLDNEVVRIGWTGSITTIQHFELALPVLERIKGKYGDGVDIKVIGDPAFHHKGLGIQGLPWNASSEVSDLSNVHIGIMPLPDDEWSKGKCGLKGLQYMGLGIPTIMSPVGVNRGIIVDGQNGFLANQEADWFEKLCKLIEDPELRKRLGERGRITVEKDYSVKANLPRYLDVFRKVMNA